MRPLFHLPSHESRIPKKTRQLMRSLLGNGRSSLAEDPFKNVSDDFSLGL